MLAGAILTLAFYFAGLHSDPAKLDMVQLVTMVIVIAVAAACIVLGIKARRATVPADEVFGYGSALGTGVMIALFAGLFGIVTNSLYMQVINPEFKDVVVASQVAKWEAMNMLSEKIEGGEAMMRKMMHPALQAVSALLGTLVMGVVISLVVAGFLTRRAAPFTTVPAPPTL